MKDLYVKLQDNGVNVQEALDRIMNNEMFYDKFLKKFLQDTNYEKLKTALETGDHENGLDYAHTLKGVCGNLGMNELFELLKQMVDDYRAGDYSRLNDLFSKVSEKYDRIYNVLDKAGL